MNSRWLCVLAAVVAACNGGSSAGGSSSSNGASGSENTVRTTVEDSGVAAETPSAADAGAVAPTVAARLTGVPERLGEGVGVIMASSAGGVVRMTREGAPAVDLRDGERVRIVTEAPGMGETDQTVVVEVRSMRGSVSNGSVITEESLHRSSDGRWAVVHLIESCGDFCHARLTLLGPEGVRRSLCGAELCAGPAVTVVYSPDGTTVAASSVDLRVAALEATTTRTVDGFVSPVYTPQGRLFARKTAETDDGVYEIVATGEPRRVYAAPGRPPRRAPDAGDSAPSAPVLEQNGTVLCASFARGTAARIARASLEGRAVAGAQPCAASR